jgi:hypothetical protein
MATIHNPTNFEPADYDVIDYLDNKPPQFYGQDTEAFELELKWHRDEMARTFGADWQKKIHHCIHCGNGNVRWITAVLHKPTNETVVFGADCTERLGFANRQAWKLAQLKSKAEAGHQRIKVWKKREAFVAAHPEVALALEAVKQPLHAGNLFVIDVLAKLNTYGDLSDRQVAAIVKSLAGDQQRADRKAAEALEVKGDAPTGRQTVTGTVLTVKAQDTDFGIVKKMLLKLANNSKVWLSVPSGAGDLHQGDVVKVTATFQVSRDDVHFSFGKRPYLVDVKADRQLTADELERWDLKAVQS